MKKSIFLLFYSVLLTTVYAQDINVFAEFGFNYPSRYSTSRPDVLEDNLKKGLLTPSVGISCDITKYLTFSVAAMREERGWYGKVFGLDPSNGNTTDLLPADYQYNYLTVPLLVEFNLDIRRIEIYANAGFNCSYNLGSNVLFGDGSLITLGFIDPAYAPKWDYSRTVGGGLRATVMKRMKVYVRYNYFRSTTPIGHGHSVEEILFHQGERYFVGASYILIQKQK